MRVSGINVVGDIDTWDVTQIAEVLVERCFPGRALGFVGQKYVVNPNAQDCHCHPPTRQGEGIDIASEEPLVTKIALVNIPTHNSHNGQNDPNDFRMHFEYRCGQEVADSPPLNQRLHVSTWRPAGSSKILRVTWQISK